MIESLVIGAALLIPLAAGLAAAWHALLYKRDPRAAFGWIGVSLLFPLVGALLYYLLGVNRVESRARHRDGRGRKRRFIEFERGAGLAKARVSAPEPGPPGLARAGGAISGLELSSGNQVRVLHSGDEVYPAMLEAITGARNFIFLTTYIFESNAVGREFIGALGAAVGRGVDVRVMIDGLGEKYSFPRATGLLRRAGVRVCRFNPPRLLPPSLSLNLRNHRKILVVDNRLAFTGGINIGSRHLVAAPVVKNPVADLHFSVQGPVVNHLRLIFERDWGHKTGEQSPTGGLPDEVKHDGGSYCRVIADGPDEDLDRIELVMQAAVSAARNSVCIMTPYFLPSRQLLGCLQGAALRGVRVSIILPGKNNLPYVHWATRNMLWELLYYDIEIYYQPPPFVHSKLLLIDEGYALVGSANIDPRSLRLNYELGMEIYDDKTTLELQQHFQQRLKQSRPVTLDDVDSRSLTQRTRDSLCWLFSPYL